MIRRQHVSRTLTHLPASGVSRLCRDERAAVLGRIFDNFDQIFTHSTSR